MEEIWKDIEGYEGLYQVSNLGRVISKKRQGTKDKLKNSTLGKRGYLIVNLCKNGIVKTLTLHRILATTFIPNPENKPCVNHIDGDKLNNSLDNLEWSTYSENNIHAIENRLRRGEDYKSCKLTVETAKLIKYGLKDLPQSKIAKIFGIAQSRVSKLRTGKIWKHI